MPSTTIILPTYEEAGNLPELVKRIRASVDGNVCILVTDDGSLNGTAKVALDLGCAVLNRNGRQRGLSAAVIDALKLVGTEKMVVMDADLQHPPELLPAIIAKLDEADMVIASREVEGGSYGDWSLKRRLVSFVAKLLVKPLLPKISDPMTGFFGIRLGALPDDLQALSPRGFKIMLELLVKGKAKVIAEVPLNLGKRHSGKSKLGGRVMKDYLLQLVELYLYKFRWLRFGLVGLSGTLVFFPVLYGLTELAGLFYIASAAIAIVLASTNNYFWNNLWTFRDKARRGLKGHIVGWTNYQVLSAVGDGLYLGLLAFFTEIVGLWYMLSAALSLILVFIFKFVWADKVIWRRARPRVETA